MILEINNESVRHTSHTDLVTLLKRCPKGNQTNFLVLSGAYVGTCTAISCVLHHHTLQHVLCCDNVLPT